MIPHRVNCNLRSTYHQNMIKKPHTALHIACFPKKRQSYNVYLRSPYTMTGEARVAAIMAPQADSYLRKMVD